MILKTAKGLIETLSDDQLIQLEPLVNNISNTSVKEQLFYVNKLTQLSKACRITSIKLKNRFQICRYFNDKDGESEVDTADVYKSNDFLLLFYIYLYR